jgi:Tfp pilus assembly protein PilE
MINLVRKNYKGFTLIEILIITAIIGILTAVGVPIYQDYVTSSKENTAKDNLQSIAFMQGDHRSETDQYFPCPKKTLSTTQIDKQFFGGKGKLSSGDYSYKMTGGCSGFIASALISNSKAKCFKIDQNRIISSIACPKEVSIAVAKTFESYKPPPIASQLQGYWLVVDSDGKQVKGSGPLNCGALNPPGSYRNSCGPGGYIEDKNPYGMYSSGTIKSHGHKMVFETPACPPGGPDPLKTCTPQTMRRNSVSGQIAGYSLGDKYRLSGDPKDQMIYNFATGIWTRGDGVKRDTNGNFIK